MKFFRQLFTPSIRRRISFTFLIVTVLVLIMAVWSYTQLRQVTPYSNTIIQNSLNQVQLQKMSAATSALDADLERYLIIRGVEYRDSVQTDIQVITDAFATLQNNPTENIQLELVSLDETITKLQLGGQQILDTQVTDKSSGEITLLIVTVYNDIDRAKQLQETISEKTLIALQETAQAQSQIANNVLNQFVILGIVVLITAFIAGWSTDRRLRPITLLTSAAAEIAEGNFTRTVSVENNDEIGTLAKAFNAMTSQLRELVSTLEQRVAARTKDQAVVTEIATEIAAIQNLQEMLERMVHLTQRSFGLYHAHVFTFNEAKAGEELKIIACGYQEGDEHEGTHGTTAIDYNNQNSIVARCARERKPVIVNDVRNSSEWLPNPLLPETRAEMAIPMIVGGRLMGVLDVQSENLDTFSPEDANIQSTLATQIAVAMQNLLQYETSQKVAADLSVVAEVGLATATITDKNHLLQEVVDLSKKSFGLYHAHIYLMNEAADALDLASGAGEVGRTMVAQGLSIPLEREQSLVARAARTQEGVVVNDVTQDPNFLPNPLLPDTHAEMAVPMTLAGKVIGVLDVQSETIGRFTEVDVNIQTTLASQIAIALENARSFETAQKQAEQEQKINLVTQKIQQADTIEKAMQIAARELGNALGKRKTMVTITSDALSREQE